MPFQATSLYTSPFYSAFQVSTRQGPANFRSPNQRGLQDRALIKDLEIGSAPGGNCANASGIKVVALTYCGRSVLLNVNGSALYSRIVFPFGAAFAH